METYTTSKIKETLDDVKAIHEIFPNMKHCNVAWLDIHDDGHVMLFGYDEDNFEKTYSAEGVWPPIQYSDYVEECEGCDPLPIEEVKEQINPVERYLKILFLR